MWVSALFNVVVFIHALSKLPVADYLSSNTPLCLLHQPWRCTSATHSTVFFFLRQLTALKLRANNNLQTCVCCCWFPSGTNHSHRNSLWTASAIHKHAFRDSAAYTLFLSGLGREDNNITLGLLKIFVIKVLMLLKAYWFLLFVNMFKQCLNLLNKPQGDLLRDFCLFLLIMILNKKVILYIITELIDWYIFFCVNF